MKPTIIATVVALATVAAPAPTAATDMPRATAAEESRVTILFAGPTSFQRGGETYRLKLTILDHGSDDSITMTLRRKRDPDGAGPAVSRQVHTRDFEAPDTMTTEPGLDHAAVVTGEKLAPYGEITVDFTPTSAAQRAPCYGARRTVRTGRIDGTVRFASGTGFDDVVLPSMRARLDSVEGGICGHGDPLPSCERTSRYLWAEDGDFRMAAFSTRRRLVVHAMREQRLPLRYSDTDAYVLEAAVTRLPIDHARFAPDLSSVTVRGMPGTDVRRRARFSATSGTRRDVYGCDAEREIVQRLRRGTLTGTMRFAFFVGADEHLADRMLQARLTHTRNRPIS